MKNPHHGTVVLLFAALAACQAAAPTAAPTTADHTHDPAPAVNVRIIGPYVIRAEDFTRSPASYNLYSATYSVPELTQSVVDNGLGRAELDIANVKLYQPFPFVIDTGTAHVRLDALVGVNGVGFAISAFPSTAIRISLEAIDGYRWRLVLVTPS